MSTLTYGRFNLGKHALCQCLKQELDGSFAKAPAEIADRWVEHFSLELGGDPSYFDALAAPLDLDATTWTVSALGTPSVDQTLAVLRTRAWYGRSSD